MIIEVPDNLSGEKRRLEIKRQLITYALKKYKGHIERSARFAGVTRRSMHNYIVEDKIITKTVREERIKVKIRRLLEENTVEDIRKSKWYRYAGARERRIIDIHLSE